jgi:hypothetical protein
MSLQSAVMIVLDRATPEEREAVHALVKQHAKGWWHQFSDVWIAGGKTSREWRDILRGTIPGGTSSLLVIALPEEGRRQWSFRGPRVRRRTRWLHTTYSGKTPPWEKTE